MGDFYEGEPWYRAAAEQGHAKACMVLADHYMVTNMDYPDAASPITEGAKWYRRGRELGQPHDPVCLSLQENCCPGGSGVGWLPNEHLVAVTDLSKPKEWIAKHIAKARSGDIVVQYCVACWCACRPDISRDLEQAYAWFRVASRDLREKGFDDLARGTSCRLEGANSRTCPRSRGTRTCPGTGQRILAQLRACHWLVSSKVYQLWVRLEVACVSAVRFPEIVGMTLKTKLLEENTARCY